MVEVITRLKEAASVLRRLPEGGRYEYPFLTSWPDYKPDPNTAYGYDDVKITPPIPSPAAIQRMEEVLVWLQLAPVEYRRLLWFRAEGWPWRKLVGTLGVVAVRSGCAGGMGWLVCGRGYDILRLR